ncbi:hypothetical protein FPV67DRAFT_1096834 [Lyophyllum atratum]|nr:hypothetical protein FPV67DRAFT_1096834 [Lyophyllum atratum]
MILPRISTSAARRPSFKAHSDDLVQFAATAATLARDIGNMSACPPAAAAASVVLLILEIIQKIKTNQEACARLARRCAKILLDLDAQMTDRWESAPALLVKNLEKFRETLWTIHHYMTLHVDLNWRTRFAKKGSIEDAVTELDGLLSEASQAFQMSTLISIHYAVSSRRKKASNESSLFLDDIPENESIEEPSSASRIQILPPIDLDKCLSFSHQPEYDFHHYLESDLETCGQNVRQYRLSDVRTRPVSQSNSKFGWWSDASEASLKCGKFVLIKRYDRDEGVGREHWLRDLTLLRRLYHPNFPQLLGSSLKNSPVPFVLLGQVVLNSPQETILESLHSTSLKECKYLVLRFFHQLQGVTIYFSDSLDLSQAQIQNFLDDASIGALKPKRTAAEKSSDRRDRWFDRLKASTAAAHTSREPRMEKRLASQDDVHEPTKRLKLSPASSSTSDTDHDDDGLRKSPVLQCAMYAAEMLCRDIYTTHAITILVADEMAWIWWFDRQGAIHTPGIDFIQDLPYFVVLLVAFQRFNKADWGIIEKLYKPFGYHAAKPSTVLEMEVGGKSIVTDHEVTLSSHYSLVGRDTRVLAGLGLGDFDKTKESSHKGKPF